jgi:hypothetical protein
MSKDDHPEPERPAVPAPEMTNDPEPEQRSLSQQVQESADTPGRVTAGLPERLPQLPRRSRQTAWARAIEVVGTISRSFADKLQEWLPRRRLRRVTRRHLRKWSPRRSAVAMPSMPDLTWRDWVLFGFTGASILVVLITAAIVVTDILARGMH